MTKRIVTLLSSYVHIAPFNVNLSHEFKYKFNSFIVKDQSLKAAKIITTQKFVYKFACKLRTKIN